MVKEKIGKHQKLSKYYGDGCRWIKYKNVLVNIGKKRLILVKISVEGYQYWPIFGSDNTN